MTQEEIIKKNAEGCAKYFGAYRKLEFLEKCLNNLYDCYYETNDPYFHNFYIRQIDATRKQIQEVKTAYGI